jgi:hypothetical protein
MNIVMASSLASSGIGDGESVCYLCLGGDLDDDSQPLQRDCACRGTDAGFVHLSCLTNYAATKSKGWDGRDMIEFREPWRVCPSCNQFYQNELAIDIASKFVSFVRRQYPDDTRMQVEALFLKLRAFGSMFERLQPVQNIEAGVMLSLIDRMKGYASLLPRHYSQMEADAYNIHGRIALDEATEESARRAEAYFKKDLKVNEAIGNAEGAATAKSNIALAKSKYDSGSNYEELVKASQELYEIRIAKFGEGDEYTIAVGRNYALNLQDANRGDEARELLTKLLATSKQVLGPHHNTTKEVESALTFCTRSYIP